MNSFTRRSVLSLIGATFLAPTQAYAAKTHKVTIKNMGFSPPKISIKAGDSVTWTNRDSARHTATANDRSWDTGTLKKNKAGTITFDKLGTYSYFCDVHPSMKAVVVVS